MGLALFAAVFPATEGSSREVYNIDAGWRFFTGSDTDSANSSPVNLPHIWNAQAAGGDTRGIGNYLKDISIPAEWQDKRVFLRVRGAETVTDVFVGSRHIGEHRGGNTAFTFDITEGLRFGETNTFRIVVNSSPRLDVLPTAGDGRVYGGIFRNVELIVCDPLSISPAVMGGDGIHITTDRLSAEKAEGTVKIELSNRSGVASGARARVRFTDEAGAVVAQSNVSVPRTGSTVSVPFTITTPRLWQGTADPYLYNVEVVLSSGDEGVTTDSLTVRTGFRTVGIDSGNNFLLNGRAMKLHGVILHRDRAMVGMALTPFQIEEDVELIRRMGANAVRVTGGRHHDYFYTLCDEAGLIVWNDGPFTGTAYPTDIDFVNTGEFRANGERQISEMIMQLYNHPSVAMWGLFSNVSVRGDDPVPYIRHLNDLVHKLDPHRLTAGSSVQDGDINFITDMISFDLSLGWESGMPDGVARWIEQLRAGWPELRAGISYSAGASIFQQSATLEKPVVLSGNHPEGWQTFFHEQYMHHAVDAEGLWGVFVGNMFDFGAVHYPWGDGRDIDDRGLVTFDRKDPKDAYWLYKANWNTSEPFVRIAGRRLDVRTGRIHTITVFSNLPEVELFLGGESAGRRTGENGVFKWQDVELRGGINRIEARAGELSDRITMGVDMMRTHGVPPAPRTSQDR